MKYAIGNLLGKRKNWYIGFGIGILVGIIIINNFWDKAIDIINVFVVGWFGEEAAKQVSKNVIYNYILIYRLKEILIILVFNLTFFRNIFDFLYMGYIGLTSSMVCSMFALKYGYKAMIVFGASILPYYFFYICLIIFAMTFYDNMQKRKYKNDGVSKILIDIVVIIILLGVESFLEAYLSLGKFV